MGIGSVKEYAKENAIAGELPEVKMGKVAIEFALELAAVLRKTPLFLRDYQVCTVNQLCKRIDVMTPDAFVTYVDRHCKVMKSIVKGKKGGETEYEDVRVSITAQVAKWVLQSDELKLNLRPLRKLEYVRLPVMRSDDRPEMLPKGYDPDSEIFTIDDVGELDELTLEESNAVLMGDVLSEFPFVMGEKGELIALSNMYVSLLNLFCVNLLPRFTSRPAFVFNSNTQKSGKSLLAKMAVGIVSGQQIGTTLPKKSERGKLKELLNSAALDARTFLLFDNCVGLVEDPDLAMFVQSPEVTDRKFRQQSNFVVENTTTLYLTGVDFKVGADMAARCCFIDLFVQEGAPGMRRFQRVLNERWIKNVENRKRILSALWGIVRHWAQPEPAERVRGESMMAGFEAYCETMGGIVMAAGLPDPFHRPPSDSKDQTERDFAELLADLASFTDRDGQWKFPEIMEVCRARGYFSWIIPPNDESSDLDGIKLDGGQDDEIDSRARAGLGKILSKRADGSMVKGKDSTGRVFAARMGDADVMIRFRAEGVSSSRSRRYVVSVEG